MATKRRPRACERAAQPDPGILLWLLRILVPLGGHRELTASYGFKNESLVEAIGLGHWIDREETESSSFVSALRALHRKLEKQRTVAALPACLCSNVQRLSGLVGLNATDCRILEFAVSIQTDPLLGEAAELLGGISSHRLFRVLSTILNLPETEICAALSAQGVLARSGLISVEVDEYRSLRSESFLRDRLKLLSSNFANQMASFEVEPASLLRGIVSIAEPAQLCLDDFRHIHASLDILLPYLRRVIATRRRGVNIFLHGTPGTGKTQLARVLASELGCDLFEVAGEEADGALASGTDRLRAFRVAQSFLARSRAIIAFDEVEDIFNDGNHGFFSSMSTAQHYKAWINRMLEENTVPTIWLSNAIEGLDPAFARRFDMVFELPVPPKKERARILQKNCGDLFDAASIARIAEVDSLAPAVVARASDVVRLISDELGQQGRAAALEKLIDQTLKAQGLPALVRNNPNRLPEIYDPSFIHADADLASIAVGLRDTRAGRLCLYGPPGTGKTAYGRWLAEQLGIPLRVKRASDLMSKWAGESEQNIAQVFRQAEQEGALLMIDEIDSFLQDRRGLQRTWEVSMVNEMLTQMEAFSGVFVASTNLMTGLDQAAMRRFDLKVKFDFLRPEQTRKLLCRYCEQLQFPAPQPDLLNRVTRLPCLTPGDFATVLRQRRFRPIASSAALVAALEAECAIKEGAKARLGFL